MKVLLVAVSLFLGVSGYVNAGEITFGELYSLKRADVYVLGETHDNPLHHIGQARVMWAVKPKAVVFEMLTPAQANKITPELLGDETALEKALDWNASSWPDFSIYYPIFAAVGDARIFGAALPKQDVRAAFKEGAAALFGENAALYGLSKEVVAGFRTSS